MEPQPRSCRVEWYVGLLNRLLSCRGQGWEIHVYRNKTRIKIDKFSSVNSTNNSKCNIHKFDLIFERMGIENINQILLYQTSDNE